MKKKPSLKQIMTPFPYAIDIDATLPEATGLMQTHKVHHLPVMGNGKLVGIVTEHDMMAHTRLPAGGELSVRDIFIADPYIVDLHTPLDEVVLSMAERHLGSVLITRHGKLAGVVTTVDVCRSYGRFLQELFPPPRHDQVA